MFRIKTSLLTAVILFCCFSVECQTEIAAIARQSYHEKWIENPALALPISALLDSLHWNKEFSAFCPTNGSPARILKNQGVTGNLSPPLTPRHPWEPTGWLEYNGTWKGYCPGDSVSIVYTPALPLNSCGPEPDLPPWLNECSQEISPWYLELETGLGPSNGSIYTKLGNDGIFNKPIVVVEGFDFGVGGDLSNHRHGSFGWHSLYGCDLEAFPGTEAYPILIDSLQGLGYDIVFIDFAEGTSSIEIKSKFVQKTIQLCNSFKQGENALVIIGASMGGVVARHALCLMEQQLINHCTRLFVSIDSPHRGANISLGLNGLVSLLAIPSSEAALFYEGLNSMAAKQLLISTPNGLVEHQEAMQMLDEMGLPKKSTNVAIANSHPEVEIALTSDPLLEWTESWWWLGTAHLIANRHPETNAGLSISASCALPIDITPFNGTPLWYENETYGYYPVHDLDIAPASVGHHMKQLVDAMNASGIVDVSESQFQPDAGFIPTWSALNCDLSEGESLSFDYISHATPWNAPEEHVALTLEHRNLILDKIILGEEMAPHLLSNSASNNEYIYNHLTPSKTWVGSTRIEEGGLLQMGEVLSFSSLESIKIKTLMCGTTLEINEGGTLNIGEELGIETASLTLTEGSYLYANTGCDLNIHPGSSITVETGAELVIDGTTIRMMNESKLNIEVGGIVRFKNNGALVFNGNGCEVILQGTIISEEGSVSVIQNQNGTQNLPHFTIEGVHAKIDIRHNGTLKIAGNNHIEFNEGSKCDLTGAGEFILTDGTMHFSSESELHQTSRTELANTSINGSNDGTWKCEQNLNIHESDWNRVKLTSANSRLVLYENTISRAVFNLNNTSFNVAKCHFNYSIFKSVEHTNANHFSQNRIESQYGLEGGAVEFVSGTMVNIQENNFSEGQDGLILENSTSTLTCNRFSGFDVAVTLRGKCRTYMNPETGGGYNVLNNNRIHVYFDCSQRPSILHGQNTFGEYGTFCFSGSLKMNCTENLHLEGNNFNMTQSGMNIFNCHPNCTGTEITSSTDQNDAIVISCNDNNPVTDNDGGKAHLESSGFDILGREINLDNQKQGVYFKNRSDGKFSNQLQLE